MAPMEVKDAERLLKEFLVVRGFDFANPSPTWAWDLFKDYAKLPARCAGDRVFANVGIINWENKELFRIDMGRYFDIQDDVNDFRRQRHVHLLFTTTPTTKLRELQAHLWTQKTPTMASYWAAVEGLLDFREPLDEASWAFWVYQGESGYQILSEISSNREMVIYKARDLEHKRTVALKVCRSDDPIAGQRLRNAAQAMAHLNQFTADVQQSVLTVYGTSWEGEAFVAMELVEGGPLADRLGTPWPVRQAAQLGRDLAQTVFALHRQGIIHREIHPFHILLTTDGQMKLTGFRHAVHVAFLDAKPSANQHAEIVGTPSYIAPEQASGQGPIGYGADIYSVGAVLYELLAGQPPFRDETAAKTLRKVIEEQPVPPRRFVPTIPAGLEAICLKCLAKKPEDRYANAEALVADLQIYLQQNESRRNPFMRIWRWLGS